MRPGDLVTASIDDALVLRERHPVLFARLSRAGGTSIEMSVFYDRWAGGRSLPSRFWAFTEAPATQRRAKARRQHDKAVRRQRRRLA